MASKCWAGVSPSASASGSRCRWRRRTRGPCRRTPTSPFALRTHGGRQSAAGRLDLGGLTSPFGALVSQVRRWWRQGWGVRAEERAVSSPLLCSGCQLPLAPAPSSPDFLTASLALCILISIFFLSWYLCPFFFHLPHPFPPACLNCASLPPSLSGCVWGKGGCVWGHFSFPLCLSHSASIPPPKASSLLCGRMCFSAAISHWVSLFLCFFFFVPPPLHRQLCVDLFLFSPTFLSAGSHLSLCPSPPAPLVLIPLCSLRLPPGKSLSLFSGFIYLFFSFLSLRFFSFPLSVLLSFPLSASLTTSLNFSLSRPIFSLRFSLFLGLPSSVFLHVSSFYFIFSVFPCCRFTFCIPLSLS